MKLISRTLQYANGGLSRRFGAPQLARTLSTYAPFPGTDGKQGSDSFESNDDFTHRIFGDSAGDGENSSSFFQKLDRVEKAHDRSGLNQNFNDGKLSQLWDGLDLSFNTLQDGMDEKLKDAFFKQDFDEVNRDGYDYRPDLDAQSGMVLDTKVLDLTKPVHKPVTRNEFETTTEEVLRTADFRNVRFLANFITEAGIIIKRSKTGISAKAQRKVAREIKTARAFGLMPFTTMGTKRFVYGRTMEDVDEDSQSQSNSNGSFVDLDGKEGPA